LVVVLSSSVAMAQWAVYSPVPYVAPPTPVTVYSPAPVAVYRPAPVAVYSPAPVVAPVATYRVPTVYYRPEIRVPGQPVRNLVRAVVP
jgi:hypothetical protein